MVKSGLILVILAIGYFGNNSVQAGVPRDAEIFSQELMSQQDQLLPVVVEEGYQNDENANLEEGSGFGQDDLTPPEIEDTDKAPPDVAEDAISKEKDQSVAEEEENVAEDKEEELQSAAVSEEENGSVVVEDSSEDIARNGEESQIEKEDDETQEASEEVAIPPVDENDDITDGTVEKEEAPAEDAENLSNNSAALSEEKANVVDEAPGDSEQSSEEKANLEHEESEAIGSSNLEEKADLERGESETIVSSNLSSEENVNAVVETPETIEDTNKSEHLDNDEDKDKDKASDEDVIKVDVRVQSEHTSESNGELEEAAHEETKEDKPADKEERSQNIMQDNVFRGERKLPAERFGKARAIGASQTMQEATSVEQEEEIVAVPEEELVARAEAELEGDRKEDGAKEQIKSLPGAVDKDRSIGKGELEDIDVDNPGASEATSSSNTVTFVIILGIVALVGIIGYFIHKRRKGHQRATPVPTQEDRELKEVKLHRGDDGGYSAGQKAGHIPEANPLILNNSHFKSTDIESQQQNGRLVSDQREQQQQQLLKTLETINKKEDDIRMMDDDAEDDGAERKPLVMSTFKPGDSNENSGNVKVPETEQGRGETVEAD